MHVRGVDAGAAVPEVQPGVQVRTAFRGLLWQRRTDAEPCLALSALKSLSTRTCSLCCCDPHRLVRSGVVSGVRRCSRSRSGCCCTGPTMNGNARRTTTHIRVPVETACDVSPGVKGATSKRLSSVTNGESLRSSDRGWPMPPAAPTTATLHGLSPKIMRPVARTGDVTVSMTSRNMAPSRGPRTRTLNLQTRRTDVACLSLYSC